MKQATLLTLCICVSCYSFAQPVFSSYSSTIGHTDTGHVVSPTIQDMLLDIMNVTGLQPNFELKKANVRNIEASVQHRKRYIMYNPEFMNKIKQATAGNWGSMALLAHEVGHHLNGHTIRKGGSKPSVELEADEFAGFVLSKLGATLLQAQQVMLYISNEQASSTHPSRSERMEAIKKGWTKASNKTNIVPIAMQSRGESQ
jgi:hypothetical protein